MTAEPFVLDRFQREAMAAIDLGHNVLVAAPTGSGKTVVAEHAVARAIAEGRRAFYTTPIKALSNQKYADLVRRHGRHQVGLLTGDNAVNPGASVVVMTTEVLRNMVYAESSALDDLAWVILDEVHYLQDTYRGPVWEEVIVHTPPSVRFVCLSATVSNADELAGWITAARGRTDTVVEHERPVELVNHFLVYDKGSGDLVQVETLVDGRPNPEGTRFDAPGNDGPRSERFRQRGKHRWGTPRRTEVVEHLAGSGLLPAICFVFSRKGCDDAARSVLDAGMRLTTGPERERIRAIAEAHTDHLSDGDLGALEYGRWLAGLEAGVAAHHAGMVPPFKEAVEACFVEGLVKVVFATETLALGINMPARSVVIEVLSKFTGEHHEDLTPSQYTQLTGRAGRRGLDPVGHALVLWSPWYGFDKVAALASSREFVLRSAFQPTYNMVVNLVRRYDRDTAHELLGRSFAQYQADQSLGRIVHRRASRQQLLDQAVERARCELGDVDEYRARRSAERQQAREARQGARAQLASMVEELAPGDVIRVAGHRLAVLSVSHRKGGVRLRVIDGDARVSVLDPDDFDEPPARAASISLPEPYNPRNRIFQRQAASALRKARVTHRSGVIDGTVGAGPDGGGAAATVPVQARAADLPVAACPDLDAHLMAASERDRLVRQLDELDRRVDDRTTSLTRRFDKIEGLLTARGFLSGWNLTARGEILARTFHESDLLVATVMADGVLDDVDEASMAGLVSMLTYEHRSKEPPPTPWYPSPGVRERATRIEKLGRTLARDEERAGLPATRPPDPTFLALAYAWAAGESFDVVIAEEDLSGGDFVRNVKQLIDLLRQVGEVAPSSETRATARAAADRLFRGIIAASSEVSTNDGPGSASPPTHPVEATDPAPHAEGEPVG
ncbi:DEAD/DEAH box helicase [Aquihabitans sp. McL0605]|uniref:DEAD/DEAH box helicase n=1 Tax=Aquihabitans sp. McL0605 TaxID=3415671 RepID=UPI003CEEB2F6